MASCITTTEKIAKTGGQQNKGFARKAPLVERAHSWRGITLKQAFYTLLAAGVIAAAPKKTFGQGTNLPEVTSSSTVTPGNVPKGLSPEELTKTATSLTPEQIAKLENIIEAKARWLEKQGIPDGLKYLDSLARNKPDFLLALFTKDEIESIVIQTVGNVLDDVEKRISKQRDDDMAKKFELVINPIGVVILGIIIILGRRSRRS